jgi:hypothetical protein
VQAVSGPEFKWRERCRFGFEGRRSSGAQDQSILSCEFNATSTILLVRRIFSPGICHAAGCLRHIVLVMPIDTRAETEFIELRR